MVRWNTFLLCLVLYKVTGGFWHSLWLIIALGVLISGLYSAWHETLEAYPHPPKKFYLDEDSDKAWDEAMDNLDDMPMPRKLAKKPKVKVRK